MFRGARWTAQPGHCTCSAEHDPACNCTGQAQPSPGHDPGRMGWAVPGQTALFLILKFKLTRFKKSNKNAKKIKKILNKKCK